MEAKITVDGVDKLFRKLRKLPEKVQRKCLRPAIRAAGREVVKAARKTVPRDTGAMRKSLGIRVRAYPPNTVYVVIGPRYGVRYAISDGRRIKKFDTWIKPKGKTMYIPSKIAHIVEHGGKKARVVQNWLGQKGVHKNVGLHGANPFMTKAMDMAKPGVRSVFGRKLGLKIEQEAAKL